MISLIKDIDAEFRARAVYVYDTVDLWRSFAKQFRADPNYQVRGDCDDWSQTCLHLLVMAGVPKEKLFRAIVASTGAGDPDHMIGLAYSEGEFWSVGDTFGPPQKVKLENNNLVGSKVGPHLICAVSGLNDKLIWRGKLRRKANTANRLMKVSHNSLVKIKGHEKFVPRSYDDFQPKKILVPGDKILGTLTIGYGHTGPEVKIGQTITEEEAAKLLEADLGKCEKAVTRLVTRQITQGQFDALCSFVLNVGEGNFSSSTLLKKINAGACDSEIHTQFRRWNKSKGQVMGGLITRREMEIGLWGNQVPVEVAARAPVEAAAMGPEHSSVWKSRTALIQIGQAVTGVLIVVSQLGELAPDLQQAGQASGMDWLTQAGGVLVAAGAISVFIRRAMQIKAAQV